MACYNCRSASGTSASLCPDCRENNRLRKEGNIEAFRTAPAQGGVSVAVYRGLNSPIVWLAFVVALFTATATFTLFSSYGTRVSTLEAMMWALLLTSLIVNLFCWALFWMNMVISEPFWALACFIVPLLIYRYVFLRFDECKWTVITHVFCIIGVAISYFGILAARGL